MTASKDILSAISPLFEPILRSFRGSAFDVNQFAERTYEFYGININPMAVEELAPRLERLNLLKKISSPRNEIVYVCGEGVQKNGQEEERTRLALERIIGMLRAFPRRLSPVSPDYGIDELEEGLLDFLVNRNLNPNLLSEGNSSTIYSPEEKAKQARRDSILYIISRFIVDLEKDHPELVDDIAQINAAAMVSEVVLDLRRPPSATGSIGNLRIILDAPLALAVMGFSGHLRYQNISHILGQLRSLRCHIGIFPHSVEELEDILFATLENEPSIRTGLLADAIRDGDVTEDEVRLVLTNPTKAVRDHGIAIERVDRNRDVGFFDERMIASFKGELVGWSNEISRDRDARSIAYVIRLRKGENPNDTLRSKYLLLTQNGRLMSRAKDFCVENNVIRRFQAGPAIDVRRLAASLWLTLGSPEDRVALSKRQLLLNCSAAIRSRPDIVRKMVTTLRQFSPDKASQLRAILTLPRSSQLLADATLNDEGLINGDNIEKVLDVVRTAAIAEEKQRYDENLQQVELKAREDKIALEVKLEQLEEAIEKERGHSGSEVERLKEELNRIAEQEETLKREARESIREIVEAISGNVTRFRSRAIFTTKLLVSALLAPTLTYATFVTASVIHTTEFQTYLSAGIMAFVSCSCILALWKLRISILSRVPRAKINAFCQRRFAKQVMVLHLDPRLSRLVIDWDTGLPKWTDEAGTPIEFSP
jgi:hypothetical protein